MPHERTHWEFSVIIVCVHPKICLVLQLGFCYFSYNYPFQISLILEACFSRPTYVPIITITENIISDNHQALKSLGYVHVLL